MARVRQAARWGLYGLGGCLALVVLLRVGLGMYLGSAAGKAFVGRKISERIGMPVEVTSIRVGLVTSSIGLRVFDPAAPDPSKSEVFAVDSANADISLFGLATSRVAPSRVDLRGLNLILHVSADGKVLTTLPKLPEGGGGGTGTIPTVALTDSRVTIRQDGRPEFALQNLNVTVEPAGDRIKLSGTLDDPKWAKWTVTGDVATDGSTGSVRIATDDGPFTMDPLASIPFVPPTMWQRVQPNGRGAVALRLWTDPAGAVHYEAEVKPNAIALTLPDANATLTNVSGLVRVTGAKVELVGTSAHLAGGTITADGDCDFGPEPTVARFKVTAEKLDLAKLPAEWKLPKEFEGKLKGKADLTLRIYSDGRIEPTGGGEGAITEVKFLGTPQEDIPIHLRQSGNQYEFQRPKPPVGRRPANAPVPTAARQEKKPADPPKADAPTTLDATIRFRDIEISELLEKLNVKLSYKISGKVSAEASVAVPVAQAASQAAYQFTGKISSSALTLEGLTVRDLSANMVYKDGKFTLTDLSGKIDPPDKGGAAGTFKGTLSAATSPPGDVTAKLTIDRTAVGEVLKALPDFKLSVVGTVSGAVSMTAPYAKLSDPNEWSGSADVTSTELVVEGRSAKDIRLSATVAKGAVTLKEANVTLEGIPVTAEASLGLTGKYPFSAVVKTTGTSITDLRKLVPEAELPAPVEGVLETQTRVTGTISPLAYSATGSIKATKLTLAKSSANHIELKWELTPEKLVISDLKADVFEGTVTGSANVPLATDKAGAFEIVFKSFDAGAASELVPDVPVKIAGKVSGKITGTIPPAKPGEPRVGNIDVDISSPRLTVQGIPADRLTGKAALKNGAIEYELEGKTLGGSFDVKGRYPGQKKDKAPGAQGKRDRGSFRVTGIDLSRLAASTGFTAADPLRGRLDANFEFENDLSAGSGRVTFTRLEWGNALLSQEVTGVVLLHDGVLQLSDLNGRVAGGELRARGQVRLGDVKRNFFTLSLTGADAKRLLAPFGEGDDLLDGPVSVVVSARFGSETRGSGTVSLPRGTVSGVQVSELRVPFTFASAAGGYGRFAIREAAVQAGSGRARADVTFDWGSETRLDGEIKFSDVPLRTIVPQLGENALFGNGRITGRFDLTGSRVRSLDDVNGALVATLSNTSVKEIPILRQVAPFMSTTGLTKPFQTGDIRATLSKSVVRVERMALANPGAQIFADGTITTSGRVDLNVVAHTGSIGPEGRGLRLLVMRIPAFGPVPISLIRDVSDFLSNRTVRLSVTGTTSSPIVRVNVGALLTEQAVRFFLSRYVLPAEAAGALGVGSGIGSMNK